MSVAAWQEWEPAAKQELLQRAKARLVKALLDQWEPYPWQVQPRPLEAQETWLLMGGRGTGKTDGGAHAVLEHINGPVCDKRLKGGHRIGIVAPTLGDAAESAVRGPSGLQAYDPRVRLWGSTGGTYVRFHNGAEGKLFGASTETDVDRLRSGGNRCLYWLEEAAAMRHLGQVLEHTRLGLRIGPKPHFVATTTPKPRPELKALVHDKRTVLTRGRTEQAHHLAAEVRQVLEELYAGTRLGRQELAGELLDDVEGALWTEWLISRSRVGKAAVPDLRRVVVAVDPNAGGPDEAGIVVAGSSKDKMPDRLGMLQHHAYVLEDLSLHTERAGGWAEVAIAAYHRHQADAVVAEVNNGGDMVRDVIHTRDPSVRYRAVHATRGKAVRAEPVVALYEQDRAHHVGMLPQLEDQQTTWTDDADWSPDRMDALVWALTDLMLKRGGGGRASAA